MSAPPGSHPDSVALRLAAVRDRIRAAAEAAGRDAGSVRLMAVSKTVPADLVLEAVAAGQLLFGENRVQESGVKIPAVDATLGPLASGVPGATSVPGVPGAASVPGASGAAPRPEWHLIGHLQRNKVRPAVELFDGIDSVDSFRLLDALAAEARRQGKTLPVLLQFNCSAEPSKTGFAPGDLAAVGERIPDLAGIEVTGLMTIGYHGEDPAQARPGFRRLRELQDGLEQIWGRPLPVLSMGMSGDLEVAVAEGATVVRVGTAIFGERTAPPVGSSE